MKVKQLLAVLLSVTMICGLIPAMSFSASAAPTLTTSYDAHKYIVGDAITGTEVHRNTNMLVKYNYGFDLLNSDASWLYNNNVFYKNLYDTWGANHTCTNEWGVEVAVNEFGLVTAKTTSGTGGNMAIPTNGYVLSGVNDLGARLAANVNVGDYVRMSGDTYYVYRTTDDSKFTDASAAFSIKRTKVKEIVDGGQSPTTTTHWTTTILCKATGTGQDGVANHVGYLVKIGGEEIDPIPSGYFALVVDGTWLKDGGIASYNAADLFKDYVAPGSIVNIGKNDIFFRHDVAAAKRAALVMTGKTDSTVTEVEDFSAYTILNDAKTKFELVDTARMQTLYDNMSAIADAVQSMSTIEEMEPYMATLYQNYAEIQDLEFEKRAVETRALWWRPLENERISYSAAELDAHIEENVSRFKELGYNQLFVEGFYNSCTIFPVPSTAGYNGLYYSQNPYLVPTKMKCGSSGLYGKNTKLTEPYDMLKRTIEICDEYDIECHLWWEVLYIGYQRHNTSNSDDFVEYSVGYTIENDIKNKDKASKYYNWLNVAHDGSLRSGNDETLTRLWFNPANEGVRTFLLNLLDYVCANYDVYSFQLDYFRHPNDGEHEFGYDSDTVKAFKEKYPAYKNTDLTASGYWKNDDWLRFRADYITTLIGEMHSLLESKYPLMALTTSPDPDPVTALRTCLQDVSAWLGNGYIDNIYPMAYGVHIPGFVTPTLVEQNADRFVSTGLSVEYKNEELEMEWIRQIRHAGADGVAHFGEIDHYAYTIWSEPAVTPTGNATRAAKVYLSKTMLARAAKMKELGAINDTQYTTLVQCINAALTAVTNYSVNSAEAIAKLNALNTFAATLSTNPKKAIENDVAYLTKIRKNARVFEIQEGQTAVSDVIEDTIPMSLDGVDYVEFNNVTLTSTNSYAWYSKEKEPTVQIELTGKNIFNHGSKDFMNFDASNLTYCGTGAIYHGGELFLMMGNVTGDDELNSDDLRDLLRANVKLKTLTADQKAISDANGDGRIDTIDTRIFLDTVVG